MFYQNSKNHSEHFINISTFVNKEIILKFRHRFFFKNVTVKDLFSTYNNKLGKTCLFNT